MKLCIIFPIIMMILSFIGVWEPNRFGAGMLWGILAFVVYWISQIYKQ